ncbi:MAG: hypothetical protein EZS28_001814 [Streblomastix strix]|uniref:Uncharacterized protein n=1 Tax=Streblomastix strix TaxID=222440 RepID=A0A5J4X670_9EUKA|nr:MAG: hypothetical protein EZS28_001814 [Streblomastix strix]
MEVQLDYIRLYAALCAMKTEIYFLTKLKGMMLDLVSAVSDGLPCQVAALQIDDMTNEDKLGYLLKDEDSVLPALAALAYSMSTCGQKAKAKGNLTKFSLCEPQIVEYYDESITSERSDSEEQLDSNDSDSDISGDENDSIESKRMEDEVDYIPRRKS